MADRKARFTIIDLLIVIVLIGGLAFVGIKFMPKETKETTKAVYTVMLNGKDKEFSNAITVGDTVSISNKEKDTGVVTDVKSMPAESIQLDSINGTYSKGEIQNKQDVYVTIESKVTATDSLIKAGNTPIKVGLSMPVRGKGYASMGFVVELETVEGGLSK